MERVRQMNEKMNVLDVQLDNCTAKDAMKIIAEYMQTEELNTVDIVTVDTLMRATQLDGMKEELEKLDLLLPGDAADPEQHRGHPGTENAQQPRFRRAGEP